jgi:guanylate kinase
MEGKGIVFVISAPSGTGKTTLIKELLKRIPGLSFSVSYTTRPPREGEIEGVDYKFVTESEFFKMVQEGKFAEWAQVHGAFYGTPKENLFPEPGTDVILDVDPQGAKKIKEIIPTAVLIFIIPPSLKEMEKRLRERGKDSEEAIQRRLANAQMELDKVKMYEYTVLNDDVEKALECLKAIILAERCKTQRVLGEVRDGKDNG